MILADCHAHLDIFGEELGRIIDNAKSAGVKAIITNGVNPESNRASLKLVSDYSLVKAAVGLYPVDALSMTDPEIDEELKFISKHLSKVAAIGEIGLDYLKSAESARQKEILEMQVRFAEKHHKPVLIHSRKAEADAVELLSKFKVKVVMHCCMGSMDVIKKGVDNGFFFSIPALISRSSHFKKVAEIVPSSNLLTETDAPFLSPILGQKSEPAMVAGTVSEIARIKGLTEEDCANILYSNFRRVFG